MSTKSTALFSAPTPTSHPENFSPGLCHALLPAGIEGGVVLKDLPEKKLRISVRPFCIATDLPTIYKWMSREYAGPLLARTHPPHELEESYACMLASDFAQPFMCLVNDIPVCQMDVYKTQQDAISLYYNARPGDYGLQLVMAPLTVQGNVSLVIRTCMEYFFSFPEVGRIVADVETGNEWNSNLFRSAGFRSSHKIQAPYKTSTLYICTRNSFRLQATH